MGICRSTPVPLAALLATLSSHALSQGQLYRIDIRVTSAVNQLPAVGGTIRVTGPGVERIEYPEPSVVSRGLLKTRGIELGSGGRMVLLVTEGEYEITIAMAGHETAVIPATVPWDDEGAAAGEVPTRQLAVEMLVSSKQLPRGVVVTVLEVYTDAEGRRQKRPLPGAQVKLWNTDTGETARYRLPNERAGYQTGEDGVVVLHSEAGLGIGDWVRVVAWKDGYESAETALTIGGGGPEADTLGVTSLSAWDSVALTLRKRTPDPPDAKLIVRVVDANTDEPVPDASVYVKAIVGQSVGPFATNAEGLSPTFALPPTTVEELHAVYRLAVRKEGYAEKWEDLPNEYVGPAFEPRVYPVLLTPAGAGHWTAAEQAAWARYRAWAIAKQAEEDPPMFGDTPTGRFTWTEPYRVPDGRIITIRFTTRCNHPPAHTAGPRPERNYDAIRGREDLAKVTIGGYPGIGSTGAYHGASFSWEQGWFDVSLSVNSTWITHPELGEVKRWAEQLAGAVGDPGQ